MATTVVAAWVSTLTEPLYRETSLSPTPSEMFLNLYSLLNPQRFPAITPSSRMALRRRMLTSVIIKLLGLQALILALVTLPRPQLLNLVVTLLWYLMMGWR